MSKSNGKQSPDVFLIIIDIFIVVFLLAFYGLGAYFIKASVIGAGCIGLGVGMIGTGAFILIMMVFTSNEVSSERVVSKPLGKARQVGFLLPETALFTTVASIVEQKTETSADAAVLSVDDKFVYFDKLFNAGPVRIAFTDIVEWQKDGSELMLSALYDDGVDKRSGDFVINISSPIKLKACEQILVKNVKSEV